MEATARDERKWQLVVSVLMMQLCFQQLSLAMHAPVKYLPGFQGPLPFELETGYIGVGEREAVQLFHYFVKSQRNATEDPVVLWLTGGPGCTSLSALLYEIGPLNFKKVKYDGSLPTLVLNPHSWTQVASFIFVDSPVGTGFSYATNSSAYRASDTLQVRQLFQFMVKWLREEHPEFISNPLYIGGDSYAGLIVPTLSQLITKANEYGFQPEIKLKGYLQGNARTDAALEMNSQIPFAHGMGLISDELYESLKKSCDGEYYNIKSSNTECLKHMATFKKLITGINDMQILEPLCPYVLLKPFQMFDNRRSTVEINYKKLDTDQQLPDFGCRTYTYLLFYYWLADNNVKRALNVKEGTVKKWVICNKTMHYANDIDSTTKYHRYLSEKGYRSLIYSGDHDMEIPFLGTQAWIRSLNYPIIDDWRQWKVKDQVAGYTRTYSNQMTFATVKGAGHVVPMYKPEECCAMFKRWIFEEPL